MAHYHQTKSPMSRGGINPNEPDQIEYVHHQFPWLSHDEVAHAIREKGPNPERVLQYLQRKRSDKK